MKQDDIDGGRRTGLDTDERAELVRRAVSTADGQAAAIDVLVRGHRA